MPPLMVRPTTHRIVEGASGARNESSKMKHVGLLPQTLGPLDRQLRDASMAFDIAVV